jgi:CHAT domain-containing protein
MMLEGRRAYKGGIIPQVVQIQVTRYSQALPRRGEPLRFLVSIHVEASPVTWQQNVSLSRDDEAMLLESIDGLRRWSAGLGLTPDSARATLVAVGTKLRDVFLKTEGAELLRTLRPTAILWCVDETVIHLPWETVFDQDERPLVLTPLGRVVGTRLIPEPGRDLDTEATKVRILAVENPTEDLAATEHVMATIESLVTEGFGVEVEVTTLAKKDATQAGFTAAVQGQDYDIIHFAGHGIFDPRFPGDVSLVLSDGRFDDEDVLALQWSRPPFIVVNSSCESGRAAPGRRIVSTAGKANGLAAAFLARGADAYLGHYFLVPDQSASQFASTFYHSLFTRLNVGTAVQEAREELLDGFHSDADLTGFGITFFGDAGTAERRDLATAQ